MKPISDYINTIPLHQQEGRTFSPVEHEDLARWAIIMDDLYVACKATLEAQDIHACELGSKTNTLLRSAIAKAEGKTNESDTLR